MSRKRGNPAVAELSERGVEARKQRQEELAQIKPVLQVRDLNHARSNEVKEFCLKRLQDGATYEQLRRELGLRPSSHDSRWRFIRNSLCQILLPQSDEEALTLTYGDVNYWILQLEKLVGELDSQIKKCREVGTYFDPKSGQHKMLESQMLGSLMKTKMETIKQIIEKRNKYFEDFMDIQRLRKMEKMTKGPSIVIINKIPRPEQQLKEARAHLSSELEETTIRLMEKKYAIEEGLKRENDQFEHKKVDG